MRVALAVFGVFHHFELARELRRHGHDTRIYSTYPWHRLQREGLPRSAVDAFPLLHMAEIMSNRLLSRVPSLGDQFGVWNATAFDRHIAKRIGNCDALIALSGAGLLAGRLVQRSGGLFICDRGSTHPTHQALVVQAEFARWGVARVASDPRDTARELEIFDIADAITVPSHLARDTFVAAGIPESKISVVSYGVNPQRFFPDPTPPPDDTFEVLFAGGDWIRKGLPYLLQAFAQVRHPRKRLRVVGRREPGVAAVLARLPLADVQFIDSVPQDQLRTYMAESHVLALPSVEEGLALVQAQALACGCPVICSEATGGSEIMTDGVEGFIVPVRDVDALRERLQQLAGSPGLRHHMRAAALARVQNMNGWGSYGDRWNQLLTSFRPSA